MIAILTGGPGLGAHVTGLLLRRRLKELGASGEVFLAEAFWQPERRDRISASKEAYQRDFRLARVGQRLFRNLSDAFDPMLIESAKKRWHDGAVHRFVVFSGLWLPVVESYAEEFGAVPVDVCHADSANSPSFARRAESLDRHREVWLFDSAGNDIPWTIRATTEPPLRWEDRDRRVLAHGGGWSMGTYLERAAELNAAGLPLDLVVRDVGEAPDLAPGSRRFMMDPSWNPWHDDGFPPFGEIVAGAPPVYEQAEDHHQALDLTRHAVAIMAKLGGGTILDAFTAATPIICLEGYGEHEDRNVQFCVDLGIGITFEAWRDTGFSLEPLARMHRRLLDLHDRPRDYARELAALAG
ncbi:hypothetical protein ACWEPL_62240 [Nonomuraea sp. NPDC004186]